MSFHRPPPIKNQHPRVSLYCRCGHSAQVKLEGPWQHRDKVLARSRCTVCGRRAEDVLVTLPPGTNGAGKMSRT